jgi:hypothetical protein
VVKNSYKTAILFLLVLQSCQNVNNQDENFPIIDMSVIYRNTLASYKICNNGEATVLIAENNEPRLYQAKFEEKEIEFIKKRISQLPSTCDSLTSSTLDGLRFIACIKKDNKELIYKSYTCTESEQAENLVVYVIEAFQKTKKVDFFKSASIYPPPFSTSTNKCYKPCRSRVSSCWRERPARAPLTRKNPSLFTLRHYCCMYIAMYQLIASSNLYGHKITIGVPCHSPYYGQP